jgi:hypothetical protein
MMNAITMTKIRITIVALRSCSRSGQVTRRISTWTSSTNVCVFLSMPANYPGSDPLETIRVDPETQ